MGDFDARFSLTSVLVTSAGEFVLFLFFIFLLVEAEVDIWARDKIENRQW